MKQVELILRYKRVGEAFHGEIMSKDEAGSEFICKLFNDKSFTWMMARYAEALVDHPDAKAIMERTDREGLNPFVLDDATTQLLRTDPVAAIRAMNLEPRTVIVRDEIKPQDSVKLRLRAGYDTLADAFGDELYLKVKDGKIECPFCGRWRTAHLTRVPSATLGEETIYAFRCEDSFAFNLVAEVRGDKWAATDTEVLLRLYRRDRYFLPRAWNTQGQWITHEALTQKYEQYVKEKESICSQTSKDDR